MRLNLKSLFLSTALATGLCAAALAPLAPVAVAQDMSGATASEVDIDSLLKLVPAEMKASYESKSYDAMTGVTTVKNLKFADPKNEAGNNVVFGEVGIRGVDMAAFAHVFDFAKYGATRDESFKQLFGDVTVKNVVITADGKGIGGVDALSLGAFQMKQLAVLPPGMGAPAPSADGMPAMNGGMSAKDVEGVKFLGALLDATMMGPMSLTNFNVTTPEGKAAIASMMLEGLNRGQFGKSEMSGLEFAEGTKAAMKIASAKADGGDISKVLPWMIKGEMPPVTAEQLMYFGAGSASGYEFMAEGAKITIASYSVEPISFTWLVPSSLKLAIADMVIVPPANDPDGLKELGLSQLDLDIGLDWAFDANGKTAQLKELRIDESQLFNTSLSIDLNGIDLAQLTNAQAMKMAAMQIGLTGAKLVLKNNGGFDKVLAATAKEENKSPDQVRDEWLAQLTAVEGGMPGSDGQMKPLGDRLKGIVAAMKSFIQSPGTLTVKMQPAQPITAMNGMGAMMGGDPNAMADALGLSVEASQ